MAVRVSLLRATLIKVGPPHVARSGGLEVAVDVRRDHATALLGQISLAHEHGMEGWAFSTEMAEALIDALTKAVAAAKGTRS